jgi:23S rRNA pseudouridine1911/1915/1917 synthase
MIDAINLHVKEPTELLDFLMKQQGISHNAAKGLLARRQVLVNNSIITQYNYQLQPKQKVQITKFSHNSLRSKMLELVYEDKYIIVVNKHEGLLSVAAEHRKDRTAYSIISEYVSREHRFAKIFVVHRLDRDTSGLMMFVKDEKTKENMREHWHEMVVDRRYVAVLDGELPKDNGTVTSWLTEDKILFMHSSPVDNGGELAITHYQVIKRNNGYTLVELRLETGKKNQIRVHMQSMGYPLVGDVKYGREGIGPMHRLALHAFKLCFYHPVTHEFMEFETPYPPVFKKLLAANEGKAHDNNAIFRTNVLK